LWLLQGKLAAHLVHSEPGNYIKVVSLPQLKPSTWNHVLIAYDGSGSADGLRLFVNGKPVKTTTESDTLHDTIQTEAPFQIGRRYVRVQSARTYPFKGLVDDVRVFDRKLSDAEVNRLYLADVAAVARAQPQERSPAQSEFLEKAYRGQVVDRLKSELAAANSARKEARWDGLPRWYLNSAGQTMMILVDPSRPEAEPFQRVFAIAAHEVTIEQYQRCRSSVRVDLTTGPTSKCPAHNVS
jgi:hypothetical protein